MQDIKISRFIPALQQLFLAELTQGEQGQFYREKLVELKKTIASMPVTYAQDGLGDNAIVHLRYFTESSDWYITEKDMEGDGTLQAYGYAEIFTGEGELGYISIAELVRNPHVELDLYWTPRTLGECKGQA